MTKEERIVYDRFIEDVRVCKSLEKKCIFDLFEIKRLGIFKGLGYRSIYDFAEKIGGFNREKVRSDMRLVAFAEKYPSIMEVVKRKGVNSVRPILSVVSASNVEYWADKASRMSIKALALEVKKMRHVSQVRVSVDLDVEVLEGLKKRKGLRSWNDFLKGLLDEDVVLVDKPGVLDDAKRTIPAVMKRYLLSRSGGICDEVGCSASYEVFHHVDRFCKYKRHDVDRMRVLCKAHHELVHINDMDVQKYRKI
jgi:hypothetical protein